MTSVKRDFPDHTMALLGELLDGLRRDVLARTAGASGPTRGLRSSQLRLLSLTPVDGMRVTDLAERVGMTKQALGEFANALEDLGLMESLRDERDRRIRILRPTAKGRRAVVASEKLIREVEEEWRERVGAETWDGLRTALKRAIGFGGEPATPTEAGDGTAGRRRPSADHR